MVLLANDEIRMERNQLLKIYQQFSIEKTLNNETLRIDTGCIVAFEPKINFDVQKAGNMKSMLFGGEGLFLASLSGTGKVWIQSMPIRKLIQAISPVGANVKKGGSSLLT